MQQAAIDDTPIISLILTIFMFFFVQNAENPINVFKILIFVFIFAKVWKENDDIINDNQS